jgi:hypothetical protein
VKKTAVFWLILLTLAVLMFSAPALAKSARDMEPGTWTGSGGHRWLKFGNYTWRVLKVAVNKGRKEALLLAEEAVAKRPFNSNLGDGNDWKTSDIREWLKGYFCDSAFSESEKGAILTTYYRYGGHYDGSDKTDSSKIFLLSHDEARNSDYFDDDDDRSIGTWWWLRSPGYSGYYAVYVNSYGYGYDAVFSGYPTHGITISEGRVVSDGAVRPALIINLSSSIFTSSSSSSQYKVLYNLR